MQAPLNNKALFSLLGKSLGELSETKTTTNSALAIAKIASCMQNCLAHEVRRFNALKQYGKDVNFRDIEKEFD
jgi:hypothetical protein